MLTSKKLGRIAFNTAFINPNQNILTFKLHEIDPDNLVKNKKIPKNFEIHVKLGSSCDCSNIVTPIKLCPNCAELLNEQLKDWKEIIQILEVNKKIITEKLRNFKRRFENIAIWHF